MAAGPRYLARPHWLAPRRLRPRAAKATWSCQEHPVGRASDAGRPAVEDVSVDHRGTDVAVAQELLDGPDIVVVFEQMGGKGVPEGVALASFGMPAARTASFTARWRTDSWR